MSSSITIVGRKDVLWEFHAPHCPPLSIAPPVFSIDGKALTLAADLRPTGSSSISPSITQQTYEGPVGAHGLRLKLVVRLSESSVVRFKYELSGQGSLTKPDGKEGVELVRLAVDPDAAHATEVRLFDYDSFAHTYVPTEVDIEPHDFRNRQSIMGPILAWSRGDVQVLAAYEHGSQWPDAYLSFALDESSVRIVGVRGSHDTNHDLALRPYETVWMEVAAVKGSRDDLRHAYRQFILNHMCPHPASRKPKVFYNTWNNQERTKSWHHQQFLTAMNEKQILAEIDTAHEMGIETYVLDVGWFESTGDWIVSKKRFPNGLGPVKEKLDSYGMELGLWFGPTTAAMSSKLLMNNMDNRMTWHGELLKPREVWETELSAECCLASGYADDFADVLIRCAKEYGVTYFKWDAVEQYGCDDPHHFHGDANMSAHERAERYAFLQPIYMARIVERVQEHVPEAIIDFDITESARCVGLTFLSVGKYFLINNGPYYFEYDIPNDAPQTYFAEKSDNEGTKVKYGTSYENINVFFHPGPARGWPCRTGYDYDRWIPSTLFLVHYLPDDAPTNNQITSIASLSLGHGGIWGDLLGVSQKGRQTFARALSLVRETREAATQVGLRRVGHIGGMVEAYDKIDPATGEGIVVFFTGRKLERFWGGINDTGTITAKASITSRSLNVSRKYESVCGEGCGVKVEFDADGRATVQLESVNVSAAIVFFGRSIL